LLCCAGDYHWEPKLDYFKATCKRIDRKHGEIDVAVSTTSRTSTYYSWTVDHITQDVPLYGNGICDTGTYVKKTGGSTSEWQKSSGTSSGTEGQVGLKNLGNTCFMNSMLQCLNAATPLKDFFLTKQYETEINTKNALGTGGRLATAYGELVEQMWSGDYASVGPTDFKQVLGEVAPQFAGYQQQDSMELFDFLIDNLHEDCNRVIVKPSVPAVEDSGKEDDLMANESWEAYLKRNNSKFTDTMMGQFRSHLTCPKEECKNEARKFDEYMSVPLPIPGEQQKELQVTLYRNKAGSEGVNFEFKVPKGCNWAEAMDIFCTKAGLDIDNIACYEHYNGKILKTMHTPQMKKEDYDKCKPTNYDKFRVYELFTAATPAPVEVADAAPKETNNSDSDDSMHTTTRSYNHNSGIVHGVGTLYNVLQIRFGYENDERYSNHHLGKYRPLMVPMPHGATNAQVLEIVEQHIAEYGGSGVKPVETPPAYEEGAESEEAAPEPGSIAEGLDDGNEDEGNSEDPATANAENAAEPEAYPKFFVLDKITVKAAEVGPYNYSATAVKNYVSIGAPDEVWDYKDSFGVCVIYPSLALFDHEKLNRTEDYVEPVVESGEGEEEDEFSLKKRLQAFSLPEQLGEMDTWYCGKCKDHVQAMKKMDLWSVPDLLTFQLKRFIYEQTNYMYGGPRTLREKIDTLVDFPQEIDMRSFVLGPQKEQEEPLMYRLYGVSNHMGGLGGGHYTAYGLHGDQWLEFNDSSVSKVEPSTVVSGDAYVLFYRRFDPVAEAEQASEAADAAADGMAPGRRSSGASELARPASAAGAASPAKEDAVDEALEAA
jgi:ubiquitin carboxyl-terminal hydrolase 4/11/15